MQSSPKLLKDIKSWKLEAKEENNSRYFYKVEGAQELERGEKCYVIGRKGSGKTAIAEYFNSLKSYSVHVRNLSFKNFPFGDLYKLSDAGYTRPSQYTTLWKFIIYNAICSMMAENEIISGRLAGKLRHFFEIDLEKALAPSIARITDATFGVTVAGTGGNLATKTAESLNQIAWADRVAHLERFIDDHVDDSSYYVLFDELDEDYKDVLSIDRNSLYFELITGLFKAVHDIRNKFRKPVSIRPIVFLRDDIYDQIQNQDKNKWGDLSVRLEWSEEGLQDLFAFRVSRALQEDGEIMDFTRSINTMFQSPTIRYGSKRRNTRQVFSHILTRTLMRPRDIISYSRECARIAVDRRYEQVTNDVVKQSGELNYSDRFRREYIDEIHSIMPYIDEIFVSMSMVRKQIFNFSEFRNIYDSRIKAVYKHALEFEGMCDILFHFSVIGNQTSQHTARVFKYQHPNARLNMSEQGVVHLGLIKSLQIT